jgi:hypothetical protein
MKRWTWRSEICQRAANCFTVKKRSSRRCWGTELVRGLIDGSAASAVDAGVLESGLRVSLIIGGDFLQPVVRPSFARLAKHLFRVFCGVSTVGNDLMSHSLPTADGFGKR